MASFGSLSAAVIGVGVGSAASAAIEPVLEPQRQAAWAQSQARILDPGTLARLVAQGLLDVQPARAEALRNGYTGQRFDALVQLALSGPPVAELLELWRRGEFGAPTSAASLALVDHGLAKAQIEPQYWPAIKRLFTGRLDPAVIALAIVRGIMADPGFLPVGPPTAVGKVPAFPTSPLDPLAEAQATGVDTHRLFVETAIAGRPMGPEAAAAATFRGIIDPPDFARAIAEGDVRNEWASAIFETARTIPSSTDYVAARLRGWITTPEMYAGSQRHGMQDPDTAMLLQIHGRPLSWHQVWIGLQRGGTYNGPVTALDPAFLKALQESDIRPEWYALAWAQRYSYPSPFVLRSLTQNHDVTQAEAEQILLYVGWEPTLAHTVSTRWAGGTGTAADPHVTKAQTQLWTTAHRSYIASESDDPVALNVLAQLGVPPASQTQVIALWQAERALIRAQLTPAQVKKAWTTATTNPATGQQWTRQEALDALVLRGYTLADANVLLDE